MLQQLRSRYWLPIGLWLWVGCARAPQAPAPPEFNQSESTNTRCVGSVTQAREQFVLGELAFREGRYRDAIGYFTCANLMQPRPRLHLYVAMAYTALGEPERAAEALADFRTMAERACVDALENEGDGRPAERDQCGLVIDDSEAPAPACDSVLEYRELCLRSAPVRVQRAMSLAGATVVVALHVANGQIHFDPAPDLEPMVGFAEVEIRSTPPGASVFVDRRQSGFVGVTPLVVPLASGRHVVSVEMPNYRPAEVLIEVPYEQSERQLLEVVLHPLDEDSIQER